MYYKSVETYDFNVMNERDALLRFKSELRESGIPFTETGGSFMQTITIITSGTFDKREKKSVH